MRTLAENPDKLLQEDDGGWSKRPSNVQSSHTTTVRLNNNPFYQLRSASVTDLPGDTNIRLWISLLNIQYSGPKSEMIFFRTKEGVPGPVAEFFHSFSSVNYVEVMWTKPTQLNGILTGYIIDVISDNQEKPNTLENGLLENRSKVHYYKREINDSDQMAARISGLNMNSAYKLMIRAKTSSGAGKPRELFVHTAKSRSATAPAEFTVSPVYGSTTALNVSLVLSTIRTVNDDNRALDNGSHYMQTSSLQSFILENSYSASLLADTKNSQNRKEKTHQEVEQGLASARGSNFSPKTTLKSIQAFAVQFKRPADETWEETEREYDKSWMVVHDLIPGQEYNMRIIVAQTPALSYVSPVRILRVPRPGEIGLSLFNIETDRQFETRGGVSSVLEGTFSNLKSLLGSSIVFQVLFPLIAILCLLLLVTACVYCWRNYGRRPVETRSQRQAILSRQTGIPATDAIFPAHLSTISLREFHVARKSHRGTRGRKYKDTQPTDASKGLLRLHNSFTDSHNTGTVLDVPMKTYSPGNGEEHLCSQLKIQHPSTPVHPKRSMIGLKERIQKETVF
uniref:Fibronectin type-III domain-containing protein n=4 Tax=Schistocephalus solidus TaxID=70667 RepID=A0A0X3PLZ3_SCHSO